MNLEYLRQDLAQAGWKELQPGQYLGIPFDLIGGKGGLTKWNVYVCVIPRLDQATASTWQQNFQLMNKKAKSIIWGKCFLLCLIAQEVAPEVLEMLKGDSFGLFGLVRLQGGGGNIFIADEGNKRVYGKVPALPLDVHNNSAAMVKILNRALNR